MDKIQTVILVLLVIAVVFSGISMIATLSLSDTTYKPIQTIKQGVTSGSGDGGVSLSIESPEAISG